MELKDHESLVSKNKFIYNFHLREKCSHYADVYTSDFIHFRGLFTKNIYIQTASSMWIKLKQSEPFLIQYIHKSR